MIKIYRGLMNGEWKPLVVRLLCFYRIMGIDEKKKYPKQLADGRWLRKKNEILERDNYTCTRCGATSHLDIHHLYYENGKSAWEYPNDALVTLCRVCHKNTHLKQNMGLLDDIKMGEWYYRYYGDFRCYAVIFRVDYVSKTICLFGSNEGSWGSPYIYAIKYRDFMQWEKVDIFEEDEYGDSLVESDYFMGAFAYAFGELAQGKASIVDSRGMPIKNDMIEVYAEHYLSVYIGKTEAFRDYFEREDIKFE